MCWFWRRFYMLAVYNSVVRLEQPVVYTRNTTFSSTLFCVNVRWLLWVWQGYVWPTEFIGSSFGGNHAGECCSIVLVLCADERCQLTYAHYLRFVHISVFFFSVSWSVLNTISVWWTTFRGKIEYWDYQIYDN